MAEIEKLDGKSMDIVDQNVEQLKALFPSVFSEGKIQFNQLEELLGNYVIEDEDHYNFTWHGKRKAGRLARTPSTGTLRPCKEESVDWDATENLFIEGDNLEVLKLLQKSYHRQVKMIYIDPPYNTGNDFVYEDDFKDGVKNYLEMTGQLDGEGKKTGTNSSAAGRYHTNWLNMMYPRLRLARNLMRNDGVMFLSIDDNEYSNLKKMCDEIFGEENFVNSVSVKMSEASGVKMAHVKARLPKLKEYILIYRKSSDFQMKPVTIQNEKWNEEYKDFLEGVSRDDLEVLKGLIDNEELNDSHVSKANQIFSGATIISAKKAFENYHNNLSFEEWRWKNSWRIIQAVGSSSVKKLAVENAVVADQDILSVLSARKKLYFYKKDFNKDTKSPRIQILFADVNIEQKIGDFWPDIKTTGGIGAEGGVIFPNGKKPLKLLRRMIALSTNGKDEEIIMDFFAGSASTGHAVLDANTEDQGNRKFLLVQIPENIDEDNELYSLGFTKVTEVGIKRLKNVSETNSNVGFKVFKLDSSNIKRWDAGFDTLESDLVDAVEYLVKGRTDEDVLYELCLKLGLDLTIKIEEKTIADRKVFILGRGYLVVCLANDINMDLIDGIGALKEELSPEAGIRVVFKDDGFKDDVVKTNALQRLKRFGIDDIKSL